MEEEKTHTTAKSSNVVHILLYTLLIGGLVGAWYVNITKSKQATPVAQCDTFEALPEAVKASYIDVSTYNQLKASYVQLESDLNASQSAQTIKEVFEETSTDIVSKEEEAESVAMHKGVVRVKDFAKCYTMDNASHKIPFECKKNIIEYVDKHPDAKYFEIIGIVDNLEFNLFNNLQNNTSLYKRLGVDQRVVDKMKKLTRRGLSKERATEASWVIKAHTSRKAATYNANYELISNHGQRGVVIRAYK